MEIGEVIGRNIGAYRKKSGYTQDHIANFIGTDRSTVSKYESNEREISMVNMEKLANLFGIELEDLLEENPTHQSAGLAFAFRSDGIDQDDMVSIAAFQKVVKNYLRMKDISNG
jgi:transcriptional regulator with XRE-family HTH domain